MPGKILGLDINDNYIAAVQVASTLKGYQITACNHADIEGNNGLENALKKIFDQPGLKSDICHCSIPPEHVSYRNLRLPFSDPKKIRQTLPFEIETMVPYPVEDLVVDFTVIDKTDKTEILSASVEKAIISGLLNRLQPYGVDPDVVEIRCVPTVIWLLKQEETPGNGLFLQMDGQKNTLVLFLQRRVVLIRTLTLNGAHDILTATTGASQNNAEAQPPAQAEFFYKAFYHQARNTIHAFKVQNDKDIHLEKVFFSGTWAKLPGIQQALTHSFEVPAEQLNPGRNEKVAIDTNIARVWNSDLMGNALALAVGGTKQDQGFNFRKDAFEKKKHYLGSRKELLRTSIFLIVLLCFLIANTGSDYYFLKTRYEALNQNITEIFRNTLPEMKKIPRGKEVDVMKNEIDKLKKSSISLQIPGGSQGVLDLLKDISQRVPESLTVHITRMVIDMEAVRISGTTDTFNTVDKIKNGLESSTCFSAATINSAKLDRSGNRVEFEIKLDRAR